ncbi:oleosin 18.2 kDa-like [Pyrus ussuriensis x Pyrus communis]|uniref:Oleosin 18.2 kDa-like n=1 Tax=Pyrus ussuriensis x Pyrus communis TaxID=2448454 RepID=A0A5N5G4U3_9ROSA|nr:oleosin 18.2 kDa-like [Pyrus ussuriensis x Pyrus communis]
MADRPQPHHIQVRPAQPRYGEHEWGEHGGFGGGGPSAGQVLAVIAGLPLGGTLLALAGLTLLGTVISALVATPLFIIFSPVLVPALFVIGLAVTGFLTSGAFGLTGLSALSWITNYIRRTPVVPETLDEAKRRAAEMGEYVGQKTKEVGQDIQSIQTLRTLDAAANMALRGAHFKHDGTPM